MMQLISPPPFACTAQAKRRRTPAAMLGLSLLVLSACNDRPLDWDMRGLTGGALDTTPAALNASQDKPQPDARGVISYPGYQIVVARRGDTPRTIASRVGLNVDELARHNTLLPDDKLRDGEVLALPNRVVGGNAPLGVTSSDTGQIAGGTIAPATVSVSSIATTSLGSSSGASTQAAPPMAISNAPVASGNAAQTATQPGRHRVARGETAYSVARLYNVDVRDLADWNGLGKEPSVREGQYLLIPTAAPNSKTTTAASTAPGQGSPTPVPPSATKALPSEKTTPAAQAASQTPAQDTMASQRTAASAAQMAMPVQGRIIREYAKGKNEGIDIGAPAGTPVVAAADGTVAAITKDTNQVPILVIRHPNNLLSVYAGIDGLKVAKGDSVKRGQAIATLRKADPSFLHFELRRGVDSIDPMTMLR